MGGELQLQPIEVDQPWLVESGPAAFADGNAIATLKDDYELRIGDRPLVKSVRALFELNGRELPADIASLPGETYVVSHAVGVTAKNGKPKRIDTIGYRATFDGAGSTIELLPSTRFKDLIAAEGSLEADLKADGFVEVPPELGALAAAAIGIPLGVGAELRLSTKGKVVGRVNMSVKRAEVQAVGNASSTATWQFDRTDTPLVGDQVLLQTLVVPKGTETLDLELEGYAVIDPSVFQRPVRIKTPGLRVQLELES